MSSKGDRKPRSLAPQAPPKHLQGAAMVAAAEAQQLPPPSLFDLFYEEFLTQLMHNSDLAHRVPEEFIRLQTDIERVEYLLGTGAFIREFEVKSKFGIKSMEKTVQFRENGNQLFNSDQAMQSILYYNKALSFAPHPTYDAWLKKHPDDNFGREDVPKGAKQQPSKYEALALCYANRSAALRKLNQYDECIRDIARAARFGYPKENIYKLWERKGKCYMSLKRFDMAVKCLRQALQALKESALSDNQKTLKSHEIGGLIKDLRHVHGFVSLGGDDGSDHGSVEGAEGPLMGNTGPIIIVQETESQWSAAKKASTVTLPETSAIPVPPKPERRSFRRKKTPATGPATPLGTSAPASPLSSNGGGGDTASMGSDSNSSHQTLPGRQGMAHSSMSHSTHPPPGELNRANSQISISQISTTGIIPDIEVPVLSHGVNPRMPSASSSVEVRYTQDKGRFFVANQELSPGDVILREEPYVAVLRAIFRVNHCAHCLKKIPTPIPCFECATVQYCGEVCRDLSWVEYHQIECGILAYLEPSRYLGKMLHLALRIITKTGMQNLIQHSMVNGGGGSDGHTMGVTDSSSRGLFDPTSYRSVHNLAANTDRRPFEDLMKKTCEAIFMAKCLKFNGFFSMGGGGGGGDTQRAEIFISSLLLRHLQIASTNGLEMAECMLKNNDVRQFDIIPVGGAIFPTMSFFNHSCYPNAQRLGYQNVQVVRILRSVVRGEEINIDYGFDFYANTREERQRRANQQYFFDCQCQACCENWPQYNELLGRQRQMRVRVTQELSEELGRQMAAYKIGMDFLLKLDITTAMPIFKNYLMVMNEVVEHPDPRYIDCEEAYKQCLWLENRGYRVKGGPAHDDRGPLVGAGSTALRNQR